MNNKNFFITTPIYYVNDRPHIGHAYTSVACDVLARFKRLSGYDVKFLTGTDEHGQKVEKSARAAGVSPQELADRNSQHFRELTGLMHISNDDFIRTTEDRHKKSAQALWSQMEKEGHIYLGSYSGWYSVRDEAYYQESELVDGPKGKMAPTGAEVEWVEEPSYFFRLSAFEKPLLAYYEQNPAFIGPETRKNEVVSFVKGGLKDLSISRTTFSWGIPVPNDEKHVMYVWLDALVNYLSALGYPDTDNQDFKTYWPANLHMVGKDIIRFHTVYWPAFLMAAKLPLPDQVFAHGWWTIEGEKMSKSLGNAIAPQSLVEEFGLDQTRWFMMREVPFGNDGNFSREGMIGRINSELANNIGNLVQRTLSMVAKNCDGRVPDASAMNAEDEKALDALVGNFKSYSELVDSKKFHLAFEQVVNLANEANLYIDQQAPWKLKKEDPKRMEAVLYVLLEYIRVIAIMLQPVMPGSSGKILSLLGIPEEKRLFSYISKDHRLSTGASLLPPEAVFPRFVEKAA